MVEEDKPAGGNFSKNSVDPVESEVIEEILVVEEEPEVEVVEIVEVVEEPKPKPKPSKSPKPSASERDGKGAVEVSVTALTYSSRRRNSGSVAVLQDRLAALDYAPVRSDLRGWFHDGTKKALESWQKDSGLEVTGVCSQKDAEALFAGQNVELVK